MVVHEDEVFHADLLEVHREGVDPEVVEQLRIASGDVAGDALIEAELPEQTKSRSEALLAVPSLVLRAAELRKCVRDSVGRHDGESTAHIP
jgi:hypothetical protein